MQEFSVSYNHAVPERTKLLQSTDQADDVLGLGQYRYILNVAKCHNSR